MRNNKGQFMIGNIPSHAANASFICLGCKQKTPCHPYELAWRKYCNLACKKKYRPKVICKQCSKEKQISPCLLKAKKDFFCNQKCKVAFQTGKPNEYIRGEKHPLWSGKLPNEGPLHQWLKANFKPADHCSVNGHHRGPYNWANKSYQYLRDLTDWEQLCLKCHIHKDTLYRKATGKTTRFVFDKNGKRL